MWRPWTNLRPRFRLSTLILLTIIAAMAAALVVQERRQVRLRAALRAARNHYDEAIRMALEQPTDWDLGPGTPFEDVLRRVKRRTAAFSRGILWNGIPIYVDPVGMQEAGVTLATPVNMAPVTKTPGKIILRDALDQLKLDYLIKDGLLRITSKESIDEPLDDELSDVP